MEQFEETALWARTLAVGKQSERAESARKRLRESFFGFRERAIVLANEIPQNLRTLTVHDATHLDALWEIADLIIGSDYDINPLEAFVLGGTFLLHDLGMSLSSYQGGLDDLKLHESWPDIVFSLLKNSLKRTPSEAEILSPGAEIEIEATNQLLRDLHAKHAAELALLGFSHKSDNTYFLIEDVEIRSTLGHLIGQIAYSHWWSIEKVTKAFNRKIGAMVFCPREWTIDPLKIACILRAADACHLDARRAPAYLRALRKPSGIAELHWVFQEHLQKPTVENQRLVFTASNPFGRESNKAWWLCFEMLGMADRELRHCDSALADCGKAPFAVRGIAGSEDPDRMRQYIPTEAWEPVDIKIRVGNVPSLVEKLGGISLYGDNVLVPLRELIQNAGDAVRARRVSEGRPPEFGNINVEFLNNEKSEIIQVSDSGVGMTKDVLIGPFLDFGESYWGSRLMQHEHPGLYRKGFHAVGGFGIGFYSVFMWGDNVKVITRGLSSGPADTLVLHFQEGLVGRPVLRLAEMAEQLKEPGTTIVVELSKTSFKEILSGVSYSDSQSFFSGARAPETLSALCSWLFPLSDTEINTKHQSNCSMALQANDWTSIDEEKLLSRISAHLLKYDGLAKQISSRIKPLIQDGKIVARLGICIDLLHEADERTYLNKYKLSIVTAGLLRSCTEFFGIAGISIGVASTASRMSAESVIKHTTIRDWANEQRELILGSMKDSNLQILAAKIVREFNGDTGKLCIAETITGFKSFDDIVSESWPDEIIIVQEGHWNYYKDHYLNLKMKSNVIAVDESLMNGFEFMDFHLKKSSDRSYWKFHSGTLQGAVVEAIALAWKVSLDEVICNMDLFTDDHAVSGVWAESQDGEEISHDRLTILRRPLK